MFAWGGDIGTGATFFNSGGLYDPATDSWTSSTTTGAPQARRHPVMVWTGSKAVAWGGQNAVTVNTGGQYDPVGNSWTTVTTAGAPSPRASSNIAVWSTFGNGELMVWGGWTGSNYLNTGGIYFP
jgi:hypothetical protein